MFPSLHANELPLLYTSPSLFPTTSCPCLGALADMLRVGIPWPARLLVSVERERLRGTAGLVRRLEGSSLLAKASVPTAKALHYSYFECFKPQNALILYTQIYRHNKNARQPTNSWRWENTNLTHPCTCACREAGQSTDEFVYRHTHIHTHTHTPAQLPICFLWGITLFSLKWISIFKSGSEA